MMKTAVSMLSSLQGFWDLLLCDLGLLEQFRCSVQLFGPLYTGPALVQSGGSFWWNKLKESGQGFVHDGCYSEPKLV